MTSFYSISRLLEMSAREIHELYKLRVDIFVHEQRTPYAEIDDADIHPDTHHVLAWDAKANPRVLVGCARISPAGEGETLLGRIALTPSSRGTGRAPEMIDQALEFIAHTYPGNDVVLNAQAPLVGYYSQFGFEAEGELFDDAGVPHQPMRLTFSRLASRLATKASR